MQKSKLGISVGLLCAILYLSYILGGTFATVTSLAILAYILICEENIWLKKSAVKSLFVFLTVGIIIPFVLSLIPQFFNVLDDLLQIFDVYIYQEAEFFNVVNQIFSFLISLVGYVENILYVGLALLALKQSTLKLPVIDDLVNKFMD